MPLSKFWWKSICKIGLVLVRTWTGPTFNNNFSLRHEMFFLFIILFYCINSYCIISFSSIHFIIILVSLPGMLGERGRGENRSHEKNGRMGEFLGCTYLCISLNDPFCFRWNPLLLKKRLPKKMIEKASERYLCLPRHGVGLTKFFHFFILQFFRFFHTLPFFRSVGNSKILPFFHVFLRVRFWAEEGRGWGREGGDADPLTDLCFNLIQHKYLGNVFRVQINISRVFIE